MFAPGLSRPITKGMGMITLSVTARRGIAAASLTAVAAMVAACGSSGSSHSAPQSPATASPSGQGAGGASGTGTPNGGPPAGGTPSPGGAPTGPGGTGLAACTTSQLSVTVASTPGGGAAGSVYMPIQFTNSSGQACSLYGYPGVSFVTGQGGSQLGAAATRNSSYSPAPVTLASHATAHAWLQAAEAGNYPASSCHMVTATWLRVFPPASTVPAYVNHTFSACSSPKANLLTVMPVRAGAAVQGQVP
jgi:hypothetical protein